MDPQTFQCLTIKEGQLCDVGEACQLTSDAELFIHPRVQYGDAISWNLASIEGIRDWEAPLETAVDYSPVNTSSSQAWTELADYAERDGFFETGKQLLFGSEYNIHYRLRIRDALGNVYVTRPVAAADNVPIRMRPLYNEAIRRWFGRSRRGELRKGIILKRKRWGPRCPDCLDRDGRQKIKTECQTCFDTHFEGGYYVGSTCAAAQFSPEQTDEEFDFGKGYQQTGPIAQLLLLNIPQLYVGDVWIDLSTDERWVLGGPMKDTMTVGNVRLFRSFPAARLDFSHVVYGFRYAG